ncbi:hypothetical protein [Streptomyces narbonensis]|uniref:hypothetical protein n=1 Tax=Streptomyces narbonensis TaxID=67333 RepID=UPI001675A586|nr:hypothetical protein [Streptomyces narbonensis]GGW00468.1 hypothetical protein GCM10010230_28620 [Streptomyces narbonensis]
MSGERARGAGVRKPEFPDTPLGASLLVLLMGGLAVQSDTPGWLRVVTGLLALAFLGNFVVGRVRARASRVA